LTSFFKVCSENLIGYNGTPASECLYIDMPKFFVYDTKQRSWKMRKNCYPAIGRIVAASPRDSERFYLRMLLCYQRGPVSYEALRTVNDVTCSTNKEAAYMPYQLRELFANLLTHCEPTEPENLWRIHKTSLSEDFYLQVSQQLGEGCSLYSTESRRFASLPRK